MRVESFAIPRLVCRLHQEWPNPLYLASRNEREKIAEPARKRQRRPSSTLREHSRVAPGYVSLIFRVSLGRFGAPGRPTPPVSITLE